jgi:hypothetical protein
VSHEEAHGALMMSPAQRWFVSWTTDVLIYVVILNLFEEFSDAIVIESFWISLLTAVVLKVLLDIVLWVEHQVSHFWDRFEGTMGSWFGFIATMVVLFAGKFFILYGVEAIFGEEVHLGHLASVTVLVMGLLLGETVMHWIYRSLGPDELEDTVGYPSTAP